MLRLILSNSKNVKDQLELHFDCFDSYTSETWQKLLVKSIDRKIPIKKHVSFQGFIEDKSRTLQDILTELRETVNVINNFNFAKHAVLTKQRKIKKDFNIKLDFSIDNLIANKQFNFDVANQLHDKFVQLEGAKIGTNLENVSPYFDIAPSNIRWNISKINNLAHELYHYGSNYQRQKEYGWYNPEIHTHFYNYDKTDMIKFIEKDNDSFNINYIFGQVLLGDVSVGKTYWDAFNDKDDHILNEHLIPPTFNVADFHVYLGYKGPPTLPPEQLLVNYKTWLQNRGLEENETTMLKLGNAKVGQFDYVRSTGMTNPKEIIKLISDYTNIYGIVLNDKKVNYEWLMSEEEIDIKYHA
tara:strand:- start:293 stop:1357 length:1065 start_codon:yes stop_codon:yes gene_type:complete